MPNHLREYVFAVPTLRRLEDLKRLIRAAKNDGRTDLLESWSGRSIELPCSSFDLFGELPVCAPEAPQRARTSSPIRSLASSAKAAPRASQAQTKVAVPDRRRELLEGSELGRATLRRQGQRTR